MQLLEVVTNGVVRTISLTGARMTIGRGEANNVVLDGDGRASRNHAVLTNIAGNWMIEDCGSTNGTYVNSVRISGPVPLTAEDRIYIGSTVITCTSDRSATAQHRFVDLNEAINAGQFHLTVADRQLLSLVASGASDEEIAKVLRKTPAQAAKAVNDLAIRMEAPRRIDLARLGSNLGVS